MHVSLVYTSISLVLGLAGGVNAQVESTLVINRDVAIIGGGSSGVYAALRLRDSKKSVIVIEKQDKLGGHSDTYVAPNGYGLNYGVVVWGNTSVVRNYFARFNIPLINRPQASPMYQYVNFAKGQNVSLTPTSSDKFAQALEKYAVQLKKYPGLQAGFNMTYPVAPDLLLPFGKFLQKYNCTDLIAPTFPILQGYVPMLGVSTLYMLKYLNTVLLQSLKSGFLTTEHHNTQELYEAALTHLKKDVLLSSNVISLERNGNGNNTLYVRTPRGDQIIRAKKVVFALQPLDIDFKGLRTQESYLFNNMYANGYYSAILKDTGLPSTVSFRNADATRPYGIPKGPGPYGISTDPHTNLTQTYYGSIVPVSVEEVKAHILATIRRLQKLNGYPKTEPSFVAFSDHSPFNSMVPNDAIKKGYYKALFALQGKRDTFYTGAAFHVQDSTYIWQYTEDYLLPLVLEALE